MSSGNGAPKLSAMEYRVVKTLGTGAGSTILLISDTKLGGRYALKVVKRQDADDDIYVAQALHEFDVAQMLGHPCLLKVYDSRTKRKWLKVSGVELLMEYVDGKPLDEIACDSLGQLVLCFVKIASAMVHMHRRGVYHGDLKPGNILLSRAGEVKVIDFGTAWIKGQDKNRVQGTPQYMAPEQAVEKTVDEKTDIYNFGATMYRLVTKEYANLGIPGVGDGGLSGRNKKVKAPIEFDHDIPGTLNETIMACLANRPERRPAGMFEIQHQLEAVARYMGLGEDDLKGSHEDCD
jgi:eukaryotic-like serine/threonine-protein kinase